MGFLDKLFGGKKEVQQRDPQILIQSSYPGGAAQALVEQDGMVAYFYLFAQSCPKFPMKACWIRNLRPAPTSLSEQELKSSDPQLQLASHCLYPQGQPPLKAKNLEIVWLPEGDGAALLENGELLSVIPSWSGIGGFKGYARDCVGSSTVSWELSSDNAMRDRVISAKAYWAKWEEGNDPFVSFRDAAFHICEKVLGKNYQYYALDRGEWPPIGLYRSKGVAYSYFVTLGVSLRPQPATETISESPQDLQFVEFAMKLPNDLTSEEVLDIADDLGSMAHYPWMNFAWFGHGHSTILYGLKARGFDAAILTESSSQFPELDFGLLGDPKTKVLWVIPITSAERDAAIKLGTSRLLAHLYQLGDDLFRWDRPRFG